MDTPLHQKGDKVGSRNGRQYEILNGPIGGGSFAKVYVARPIPQLGVPRLALGCKPSWKMIPSESQWFGMRGISRSNDIEDQPEVVAIKVVDKTKLKSQTPEFWKVPSINLVIVFKIFCST